MSTATSILGKKQRRRAGFLFVELMIGLVITAMVMLAMGAILTAVADGWTDQQMTQSSQLQSHLIYNRVRSQLAAAKFVGACNPGAIDGSSAQPGSIFFWQNDNFGGVEAGQPRVGEMAVIVHDPATQSLYLYQPLAPAQMNGVQITQAGTAMTLAQINDVTAPGQFESLNFVSKMTLGGPGSQVDNGTRIHIIGFQVSTTYLQSTLANTSTQLPVVEFAVGFSQNGSTLTLYNTSTLKGPANQPN